MWQINVDTLNVMYTSITDKVKTSVAIPIQSVKLLVKMQIVFAVPYPLKTLGYPSIFSKITPLQ